MIENAYSHQLWGAFSEFDPLMLSDIVETTKRDTSLTGSMCFGVGNLDRHTQSRNASCEARGEESKKKKR